MITLLGPAWRDVDGENWQGREVEPEDSFRDGWFIKDGKSVWFADNTPESEWEAVESTGIISRGESITPGPEGTVLHTYWDECQSRHIREMFTPGEWNAILNGLEED